MSEKKHTLWVIGFMGDMVAYLDIPKEEALRRWVEVHGDKEGVPDPRAVHFNDAFGVYDAYPDEWGSDRE